MSSLALAHRTHRLLTGLAALALVACGESRPTTTCDYQSENLLKDSRFESLTQPRARRNWQYTQHAGEPSFDFIASDGILTAEKTGTQPWGLLAQSVPAKPLRNRRIEFSAELKLDVVKASDIHAFKSGAGLALLARQSNRLQLNSMLDHEPHMGQHDWHLARLVVQMPAQMNFVRAGLLHQAEGRMQVRNPSLRVVGDDCPVTISGSAE